MQNEEAERKGRSRQEWGIDAFCSRSEADEWEMEMRWDITIGQSNKLIHRSLLKDPNARPTYAQLLEHPFLLADKDAEVDMAAWVAEALERRAKRGVKALALVEA